MRENLVLIGMPGSGKSTLGQRVAKLLDFSFIDLDDEIVKMANMPIPEIFARFGEAGFRQLERKAVLKLEGISHTVVGTGGGIVLAPENVALLRRVGFVCLIDRPLEELAVGGDRPLSVTQEAVAKLYRERRALYEKAADATVSNTRNICPDLAAEKIVEAYREN